MDKIDKKYIIAIDGFAATGKSFLAKELAKRLNILYIDTGAMYRALGYFFVSNNISLTDENIEKYLDTLDIKLEYVNLEVKVYLNNEDITDKIRTEEVSMAASDVSKNKNVRQRLVKMQREMAGKESVVLEGRDTTSVVFPNADLKIYLVASPDVRALRRQKDLEKKGQILSIEEIKASLQKRDLQDSTRKESPLIKVEDAIEVDTTNLSKSETVEFVINLLKERVTL